MGMGRGGAWRGGADPLSEGAIDATVLMWWGEALYARVLLHYVVVVV
jgi:hypothetical protein|tara:strand:+ start:35976 stop:36116 length:141 start_codon:yes stop_codon:yes gene_type:complete